MKASEMIKKILAWAALACVAVFIVATAVLSACGTMAEHKAWSLVPLTLFLLLGGLCLFLRWIEQQVKNRQKTEADQQGEEK